MATCDYVVLVILIIHLFSNYCVLSIFSYQYFPISHISYFKKKTTNYQQDMGGGGVKDTTTKPDQNVPEHLVGCQVHHVTLHTSLDSTVDSLNQSVLVRGVACES